MGTAVMSSMAAASADRPQPPESCGGHRQIRAPVRVLVAPFMVRWHFEQRAMPVSRYRPVGRRPQRRAVICALRVVGGRVEDGVARDGADDAPVVLDVPTRCAAWPSSGSGCRALPTGRRATW